MVVNDFDIVDIAFVPTETQPPLIIDPDGVLSLAITLERFESISRQPTQIVERGRHLEDHQLALRLGPERSKRGHR